MRQESELLLDILESIQHIEKYAAQGKKTFQNNELVQAWFVRHLQIIGEAARKLPAEFKEEHPEVPWTKIIGMRHILVHQYFEIDVDLVWTLVEHHLPQLKRQVESMRKGLAGSP